LSNQAKLVAIIPARGGSKRIPGKNVRPFFGHPLMAYGIAAAVNSGLFQRVVVSTDDPEIGRVAEWYGAEYLQRPPELATDTAKSIDAVTHALRWLARNSIEPEFLCQLFPNCPLVTSRDVLDHWRLFHESSRSFQISVVTYRCVHPEWAMVQDQQGRGSWLLGSKFLVRSQELSHTFCPTGAVWWARRDALLEQNTFYGDPFYLAEIDGNRGVDIDDREDLTLADLLVRGLTSRDGRSPLEPMKESYLQRGQACSTT
jgi:CMP-N-acetylneuraminic acid synthetase